MSKSLQDIKVEKTIYQPNALSYNLIMLVLAFNVYFVLQILQVIDKDIDIGFHVLFNIFMTLVLFLGAVRVKIYDLRWSYVILGFGVFQFVRGFLFLPAEVSGSMETRLTLILALSGLIAIGATILSVIKIKRQNKYILENEYIVNNKVQ